MCPGNVSPHKRGGEATHGASGGTAARTVEEIPTFAKSLTVNGKRIWQGRTWLCSNNQNLNSSISESVFRIWMPCLFSVSINSWNPSLSVYLGKKEIDCWQQFFRQYCKTSCIFECENPGYMWNTTHFACDLTILEVGSPFVSQWMKVNPFPPNLSGNQLFQRQLQLSAIIGAYLSAGSCYHLSLSPPSPLTSPGQRLLLQRDSG